MDGGDPIQLFEPFFRVEEVLAEIRVCLERGWTGAGFKTFELEDAWRGYSGLKNAHFLNSGTAALHTAFAVFKDLYKWSDGDEIISTPFTFISTNHAILYGNLRPVFADIDEHLTLDPESVAARITPRTRAVCFVGIGGNPGRYGEVLQLCRARGLKMILDATHMAGTWIGGKHAGQDADAAAFSFHSIKNLPTGDSGMICFSESACDLAARKFAWLGINKLERDSPLPSQGRFSIEDLGFKYHGNSIMAAMALVGLRYLDADNAHRRQIAGWYDQEFLKKGPHIERPQLASGCTPSRHLYQVLIPARDRVMAALNQKQVLTGWHYPANTNYPMYSYGRGSCPRAERAAARVLSLPMHLRIEREEVERVVASLLVALDDDR